MDETTAALAAHFPFQLDDFQVGVLSTAGLSVWLTGSRCREATRLEEFCLPCCSQGLSRCSVRCGPAESLPCPCFPSFQIKAIRYIVRGRSVVVSAPTGSGKTAIAEACMRHFLGAGRRIVYTTPLKALSNQKLLEMRQRFGCGGTLSR